MNDDDWLQLKGLTDAFDRNEMGALTLIMNQNENGKHYFITPLVKRGDKWVQIKGRGDTLVEAIVSLSKQWGEL